MFTQFNQSKEDCASRVSKIEFIFNHRPSICTITFIHSSNQMLHAVPLGFLPPHHQEEFHLDQFYTQLPLSHYLQTQGEGENQI